jgi:mannosyltransferase OCH1-like enzyme
MVIVCSLFISACGGSDAEPQVKKFCAQVKVGEPIMKVVARAGKLDFDKYWLEKFDKEPSKGKAVGIIRPRDLEKKTEKLKKLKDPKKWSHGQFKAMIQELGYSRHVCSVDFAKDKVLMKKVLSID